MLSSHRPCYNKYKQKYKAYILLKGDKFPDSFVRKLFDFASTVHKSLVVTNHGFNAKCRFFFRRIL